MWICSYFRNTQKFIKHVIITHLTNISQKWFPVGTRAFLTGNLNLSGLNTNVLGVYQPFKDLHSHMQMHLGNPPASRNPFYVFRQQENLLHFYDMLHNLCFYFPQSVVYFIIYLFPIK
jgi:hypothetical protein